MKRANQRGVMTGMALSLAFMLMVWLETTLAWTWYVLTGTTVCFVVGYGVSLIGKPSEVAAATAEG